MGHVVTSKRAISASIRSRLERAFRATVRLAPMLGVFALPLAAGCTAILDINKEQCSVNTDCTDLFGPTAPYLCTEHICERPACATDAECRSHGEAFATSICDGNHLCAPAECTDTTQCGVGQTCDLTTNRCVQRECDTTEECLLKSPSPTVQCMAGFCVDPTWGCIGQPDDRPHPPGTTGTIVVKLLSENMPVAGVNWQIKVCSQPQIDPSCVSQVVGPTTQYDPATGTATIAGLSYDRPVRLQFDAPEPKDPSGETTYIPMDFYTQQPPVGITEVPALRVVSRVALAQLVASFSTITNSMGIVQPVNPDLGNIYGLIFDCQGKPASNVILGYTNAVGAALNPAPVVLYFNETNTPVLTAKYSFPSGIFSSLNIALENITVGTTLVVSADAAGTPVRTRPIRSDYTMLLASKRLTTVHFYPRNYSK